MLIKSLIMLIELVFSIFLEKTTKKTNRNSSKPSSQTGKDDTSINKKGPHGKGKSENIISADNSRDALSMIVHHLIFLIRNAHMGYAGRIYCAN